jgi:hypothetical protein
MRTSVIQPAIGAPQGPGFCNTKTFSRARGTLAQGFLLVAACACSGTEAGRAVPDVPIPLDTVPLVTLGAEGSPPLTGVVGATVVDGRIVVANAGTHELLFFDRSGALQRTVGGRGDGPGEFQNLRWIQELGGRVFAYDLDLFRLSEFDAEGEFLGSVNVIPAETFASAQPLGIFADRSILVSASATMAATYSRATTRRTVGALLRYDAQGHYLDSIGSWTGTEVYGEPWGSVGAYMTVLPAGRRSAIAVTGLAYYLIQNDDRTIQTYDTAGIALGGLRPDFPVASVRISEQDKADFRDRRVAQIPAGIPIDIRGIVDRMPIPDTAPPYGWDGRRELSMLRLGKDGTVWALEYGGLLGTVPVWIVFAPDGSVRARISAGEELDLLYADENIVLVHRWDELDVETVEMRSLPWQALGNGAVTNEPVR